MQKLTITRIFRSDKDKAGNPLVTKDGRPYTKLAIKTEEYGDKWISFFGNPTNSRWQEGDTVEASIEKKGEYLNGKTAPMTVSRADFDALCERVEELEKFMVKTKSSKLSNSEEREEDTEDEPELPF